MDITSGWISFLVLVIIGVIIGKVVHTQIKANREHNRFIQNIKKTQRYNDK